MIASRASALFVLLTFGTMAAACGSSASSPGDGTNDGGASATGGDDTSSTTGNNGSGDDASAPDDANTGPGTDANPGTGTGVDANVPNDPVDGTPTRNHCTGTFASALSYTHGRLDGYVVTIIPPGQGKQCNGDDSHIHLQIQMNGGIYDVAMNTDTNMLEKDMPLANVPGGAWAEGWHTANDTLDYPTNLSIHKSDFTTPTDPAAIEAALANANHVTIFGSGYSDSTGAHDIHRKGGGDDGALFTDPLAANAHGYFFSFSTDDNF
jgi:hypothetical protein